MNSKPMVYMDQVEPGDYVRDGSTVYRVVKVTKTQAVVVPWKQESEEDLKDSKRVTLKTGKVVGGYRSQYMQPLQPDENPDEIEARAEAARAEKRAAREEQERKHQEKLQAVRDANPDMLLNSEHIALDLQLVKFMDSKGDRHVFIYKTTPDSMFIDNPETGRYEEVPAFRISAVHYGKRWYNEREQSFSMPNDVVATRTVDGLVEIIARTYWD